MKRFHSAAVMLAFAMALVLLAGCASSSRSSMPSIAPAPPPIFSGQAAAPAMPLPSESKAMDSGYANSAGGGTTQAEASPDDRRIIRTGSLNIEVADVGKSIDEITAIAGQLNGFVVSSNQRGNEDAPSGYVSIRVPAGRFNEALQKLKGLATKVIFETTNSQDVTEQYTDLQAQLKNYEATEAQYLELLKKAESVEDILSVQRELSNVRGSIERTKGRIQYIERTSDMSLIEVTLQKSRPIGSSTWDVPGIVKSAVDGLVGFGKVLLTVLIWIGVFAPIWIIVLVIIFVVRHFRKKRSARAATK